LDEKEKIAALSKLSTASVADVLNGKGVFSSSIKPIVPGKKVVGKAYTATTPAGDMLTCYWALNKSLEGYVLIIDGGGYTESAIWGSLMTQEAKEKKLAGVIIDGSIRDSDGVRDAGFPVFAITTTPRDGSIRAIGELEVPVTCGGATVHPGDYIIGDDDGVVVIPERLLEKVINGAKDAEEMEKSIQKELKKGKSLYDLFSLDRMVLKKEREDVTLLNELYRDMGL